MYKICHSADAPASGAAYRSVRTGASPLECARPLIAGRANHPIASGAAIALCLGPMGQAPSNHSCGLRLLGVFVRLPTRKPGPKRMGAHVFRAESSAIIRLDRCSVMGRSVHQAHLNTTHPSAWKKGSVFEVCQCRWRLTVCEVSQVMRREVSGGNAGVRFSAKAARPIL